MRLISDHVILERVRHKFLDWGTRVFSVSDLAALYSEMRSDSQLPRRFTKKAFLGFLVDVRELQEVRLKSPYGSLRRYAWGELSANEIALSLHGDSYLSHGTAARLHGLTDQKTSRTYVNKEQSPKARPRSLTQKAIDTAFSRKQRTSNYIVRYEKSDIMVITGEIHRASWSGTSRRHRSEQVGRD